MKAVSFLGLVLVNHLFQQLMQIILVLQHGLPQNGRLKKYGDQKQHQRKTPSKFAILSRVKPSDFRFVTWFIPFVKFDLPRL